MNKVVFITTNVVKFIYIFILGVVVQWLEHRLVTSEVAGSIPVNPEINSV